MPEKGVSRRYPSTRQYSSDRCHDSLGRGAVSGDVDAGHPQRRWSGPGVRGGKFRFPKTESGRPKPLDRIRKTEIA